MSFVLKSTPIVACVSSGANVSLMKRRRREDFPVDELPIRRSLSDSTSLALI